MTWKEIKDRIEAEGVKDEDEVAYIDVSSSSISAPIIAIKDDEGWEIRD